jgi:hypothetical protein
MGVWLGMRMGSRCVMVHDNGDDVVNRDDDTVVVVVVAIIGL